MPQLSAPETLRDWQIFAGVLILHILFAFLATSNSLAAVTMGIYSGFWAIVTIAVLVFAWRGFRASITR